MSFYRLASVTKPSTLNRSFVTSAQKRKWKRKSMKKSPKRIPEAEAIAEKVPPPHQAESNQGFLRPFLFLGIMPVVMSAIVIWSRGDLLQDLTGQGFEPLRQEFKAARKKQDDEQTEGGQETNQQ